MIWSVPSLSVIGSLIFAPAALADTPVTGIDMLDEALVQVEFATGLPWWCVILIALLAVLVLVFLVRSSSWKAKARRLQVESRKLRAAAKPAEDHGKTGAAEDAGNQDELPQEVESIGQETETVAEASEEHAGEPPVASVAEEGTEMAEVIPQEPGVPEDEAGCADAPEAPLSQEEAKDEEAAAEEEAIEPQAPQTAETSWRPRIPMAFVPPQPVGNPDEEQAAEEDLQRALEEFRKFRNNI